MKRFLAFLGVLALAGASLAASLPAGAPPGAVLALYTRNLAIKKAFFVDFQAELVRQKLTWNDLLALLGGQGADNAQATAELKRILPLYSLDAIGQEGLFAVYPDGSLLALARPSAAAKDRVLGALKKTLGKTRPFHGWRAKNLSRPEEDYQVLAGYRDGTLMLYGHMGKNPGIAAGFFTAGGKKGLKFPLEGDLSFLADFEPLFPLADQLGRSPAKGGRGGIPPRFLAMLKTFRHYAFALSLDKDGVRSRYRFAFNPKADPKLAGLFLKPCRPWPLADLPRGISATSLCFPLADLGAYLTELGAAFGQKDFELDLSAFGDRVALVSFAPKTQPGAAPTAQNPLGDLLVFLEAKDDLTAETTLLSWLQLLAASSTPQGKGGFAVERYRVGDYRGKKITVGLGGAVYLFDLGDRLALATSERAAQGLAGPRLASDPLFRKYAAGYPSDAHSLSYGDLGGTFRGLAESLLTTTPLAVSQTTSPKEAMALLQRIAGYLEYVAGKLGAEVGHTRVEGSTLVGESFSEVRW